MDLSYNKLTNFNCTFNQIKNLELNLPKNLQKFYCGNNQITKIENLPETLQEFDYEDNPIQFVDNVSIEEYNNLFIEFSLYEYNLIKKVQRIKKNN